MSLMGFNQDPDWQALEVEKVAAIDLTSDSFTERFQQGEGLPAIITGVVVITLFLREI